MRGFFLDRFLPGEKMNKYLYLLSMYLILIISCQKVTSEYKDYYRIPKVLFLTTGDGRGEGTVSDGAIIALQAFNRLGAFVRFENRSILWEEKGLKEWDIIVAPTIYGYHDADRSFSLTFMDDRELRIIKEWVKNGGVFVAGENFGRNELTGLDRVAISSKLDENSWILTEALGTPLQETNIEGFRLSACNKLNEFYPNPLILQIKGPSYILLPQKNLENTNSENEKDFDIWFNWEDPKSGKIYPAVFVHKYGKGKVVYFSSFRILHPALDGGLSGTLQIEFLYQKIYQLALGKRKYPVSLNPWPNAAQAALTATINEGGTLEEYKYVFTGLSQYFDQITFFISGDIPPAILEWCKSQSQIEIGNFAFSPTHFRDLKYLEILKEIRMAEIKLQKKFKGFRYPFGENSFWGMFVLEKLGYQYESTIPADHTEFYGGGIFPYNIPIFNENGFIRSLNLLEISPTILDDKYFYEQSVNSKNNYTEFQQKKDAVRFRNYLENFWEEVILLERGVMTLSIHPAYSGKNQILLKPVLDLVRNAYKSDKYWLTSLSRISTYWNKRKDLQIKVHEQDFKVKIKTELKRIDTIDNLTLELQSKPKKLRSKLNEVKLVEREGKFYLVFNAHDGEIIEIIFE